MSVTIQLTDRAHYDLQEIADYSLQRWGRMVANRYLKDMQTALSLLQDNPELLRDKSEISTSFKYYRVREHFLVCSKLKDVILVLTISHGQMDLPSRLTKLEPTLVQEAALLHKRLVATSKKRFKAPFKK